MSPQLAPSCRSSESAADGPDTAPAPPAPPTQRREPATGVGASEHTRPSVRDVGYVAVLTALGVLRATRRLFQQARDR